MSRNQSTTTTTATEVMTMQQHEPSIETDKLSYEIFSILESKFLFGYDDQKLWIPKNLPSDPLSSASPPPPLPTAASAERETESFIMPPSTAIKSQRGKVCILSIDGGGGMRSILSGKALAYLEQALKSKSGDPNARIADFFDVAAGTGVGGIFTAMLFATKDGSSPILHAEDTWRFLADNGKRFYPRSSPSSSSSSSSEGRRGGVFRRIFRGGGSNGGGGGGGNMKWATAGMERAVKETFTEEKRGRGLTLKDTLKPVLIPCYDLTSSAPFLFSRADALESDSYDFRLWEVCRATSAEPGRFEPVDMRSADGSTRCVGVDGGLAMSNPAAAAITHVLHNKQEFPFVRGVEDLLVLSLGSGGPDLVAGVDGLGDFEKVRGWRSKDWARPIARIASDGAADLVDHSVALAFGQARSTNYVRIQANGSGVVGRCGVNSDSDPSLDNVKKLIGLAEDMLKQKNVDSVLFGGKRIGECTNAEKLDWFAGELVIEHQRRSCRIAPTVAFKQAPPPDP
ncbi:hypothetical protein QJS10_CPB18g02127 [Acorus calamus]|uniref:Patatin n=1 Tax=Acorus calamus TaxID=4465 RepID=A0AAV9CQH4_ACOCL|nr:hypothetical protein QJS10_CPB18g02127 [Acorus calamus]